MQKLRGVGIALLLAAGSAMASEEFDACQVFTQDDAQKALGVVAAAEPVNPKAKRPKVVATLHGTDTTLLGRDPGYGPAIRHALERTDAITTVSEFLRGETLRLLGLGRPVEVIHNFFSPRAPTIVGVLATPSALDHGCTSGRVAHPATSAIRKQSKAERITRQAGKGCLLVQ